MLAALHTGSLDWCVEDAVDHEDVGIVDQGDTSVVQFEWVVVQQWGNVAVLQERVVQQAARQVAGHVG